MGASLVEKLASKFWKKNRAVANPHPSTCREIPAKINFREDALKHIGRESEICGQLEATLLKFYPQFEYEIQKMASSYREFAQTGKTPTEGYYAFRNLYFKTEGTSNDLIAKGLTTVFPKLSTPQSFSSIFGTFTKTDVLKIADKLREGCVARLDTPLPRGIAKEFYEAVASEASKRGGSDGVLLTASRTFFRESVLLSVPIVNKIAADPLLYFVASEYLDVQPAFIRPAVWASRPHDNSVETLSEGAQLFHVDMSNPKFFQVFIYLSDVDEYNGPHCLIPGTHRLKPKSLWRDGRVSDEEMALHYPKDMWQAELGLAGTTFIVDTSAFHKGCAPLKGERRIASFYYANSLFGEHLPVTPDTPPFNTSTFGGHTREYPPRFFSRFALRA